MSQKVEVECSRSGIARVICVDLDPDESRSGEELALLKMEDVRPDDPVQYR